MTTYSFVLYAAGTTERSTTALANLRLLCCTHIPNRFEIKVVDVLGKPELADEARVFATPTVVRVAPPPRRRVIGDLADTDRAAAALGLLGVWNGVDQESGADMTGEDTARGS
ncbi:circadian clock KaiB family protein [Streptomyces sp. NPDC059009]|uniref:circadian clock KaiB family protein n=1 Tax=Streptomyces sp. NPDC059009 TaxID=3346694 RepID=UPI0036B5D6D0